jgi:hypothetical protein
MHKCQKRTSTDRPVEEVKETYQTGIPEHRALGEGAEVFDHVLVVHPRQHPDLVEPPHREGIPA